jgi:transketolase
MMVLFHCVLQEEDGFILSKGHSAGALYVTLWSRGKNLGGETRNVLPG